MKLTIKNDMTYEINDICGNGHLTLQGEAHVLPELYSRYH